MSTQGDRVTALLGSAKQEAIIVAPFMRSVALSRLLDAVPAGVETTVVTRWRALDLLAGASDLEVFDVAEARDAHLLLRHDLHGKLFAADEACLVGSVNVTATALGWRTPPNLELLTTADRQDPGIREFEAAALGASTPATLIERNRMIELVERLREQIGSQSYYLPATTEDMTTFVPDAWIPRVSNPEDLYAVYRGDLEAVSRASRPVMLEELEVLGLAPGMTEAEFHDRVSAAFSEAPVVKGTLDILDETGDVTEDEFEALLSRMQVERPPGSITDALVVLQRWLSHFMQDTYETAQHSIRLIKARRV